MEGFDVHMCPPQILQNFHLQTSKFVDSTNRPGFPPPVCIVQIITKHRYSEGMLLWNAGNESSIRAIQRHRLDSLDFSIHPEDSINGIVNSQPVDPSNIGVDEDLTRTGITVHACSLDTRVVTPDWPVHVPTANKCK